MVYILTGLFAGFIHVVTGPDHLAAISPIAMEYRTDAPLVGFRWGVGHVGGVLVLGLIALLLREAFPMDLLSSYSDRIIGIVLIGIGLWGIKKAFSHHIHIHHHEHDNNDQHIHYHIHTAKKDHLKKVSHKHKHTAFGVGLLHGAAGSSHIYGIIPAISFSKFSYSVAYLLAFSVGTIAAMVSFSFIMGKISEFAEGKAGIIYRNIMITIGTASLVIGFVWIFV